MVKKVTNDNPVKGLSFLYYTKIGRLVLKPIVANKFVSNLVGWVLDRRISCVGIKPFIRKNNIKMDDYENKRYSSFNDFFIRKIKEGKREIIMDDDAFISPCDSKLMVYKIDDKTLFKVKNSVYDVFSLTNNNEIAKEFKNGYALVFRLSPSDYHRYYFVDNGKILKKYKISGKFHTVNPIVYDKFKVFKENTRECTLVETKNFDKLLYVEVGALLVGKISNHMVSNFKKGEEKGYFMYGGSTVIILVKNNKIKIDYEIQKNSNLGYETYVKLGEKIAKKL